ncbi:TPA: glycosyltransferase [Klebsiella aerogenes]|uniref:GalNac(5)-diNAcBac-PP-undecaprenol beta-13-glucosyltransferase n=2 Tax=Klebsiella aerogenes TaxID=548 RepID=A0A346NTJ0_KLEAE|nr:glycosyltransferase [Klebsiella aerogenes]AXR70583.1 GalNac(5)-diNAcBac-PP-undecaprenol beta-13-glucosyltransferase [Klebsiella aerogenes]EIV6707784.1 glycosyltransferase [Klebsiella aerogenes]EIV9528937.1 glycosyltransferase [Klebsiella aerogenes]EIW8606895.1 glycosyltransferase [Klebsiella aerogenes]EKU8841969.1 glycosyltransferase [Klebsiella aerogenes]
MLGCQPLVSIYITTHNRVEKLKRAICSAQNQTYANIEILICDDASTDETQSFVEKVMMSDHRVQYFRNDSAAGACAARNLGIFGAQGEFITGLDDDDEFTPERVELFVANWDEKYSFLCCNFIERYRDGKESKYYKNNMESYFNYKDMLFDNTASNQVFTLTGRLVEIGGFDIRAKRLQDWDTWLRLSHQFGQFKRLNAATYIMHHDHKIDEKRVSKSYPLSKALNDLKDRNRELYVGEDARFMEYIISSVRGESTLLESMKWSAKKKTARHIAKHLAQNVFKLKKYE